ncbi:MAG: hypothetical protein RBU23_07465 [Candidatus Auribacterota bacterium]|nr:hypothetical protein [Candidatus Auribacterota bacterium]
MNTLVLIPKTNKVSYAYIEFGKIFFQGVLPYRDENAGMRSWAGIMEYMSDEMAKHGIKRESLEAITVHGVFGASDFDCPRLVDDLVLKKLENLIPRAPLHLPQVVDAIKACRHVFLGVPTIIVFETSFFVNLAAREHKYALDNKLMTSSGIRRYGYCGIYHQAACKYIVGIHRKKGLASAPRIISICLESRPEIAAVTGTRPVMVTSGATPLEGLPSEKSCGEIDPSIAITLVQSKNWGPEQINLLLTRQSGVYGLTGKQVTLDELFWSNDDKYTLAKELIKYRMLLGCGSAIAAMGGVDYLVFSGKYTMLGNILGPWLSTRMQAASNDKHSELWTLFYSRSREQIMVDEASLVVLNISRETQAI